MTDEPDLEMGKVPDALDDEWPADRARQKAEAHRLYRERVLGVLTELARSPVDVDNQAGVILSAFQDARHFTPATAARVRLRLLLPVDRRGAPPVVRGVVGRDRRLLGVGRGSGRHR